MFPPKLTPRTTRPAPANAGRRPYLILDRRVYQDSSKPGGFDRQRRRGADRVRQRQLDQVH